MIKKSIVLSILGAICVYLIGIENVLANAESGIHPSVQGLSVSPGGETRIDSSVFLPIISVSAPPSPDPVTLVSPTDGAQLNTLIPLLVFETKNIPANTGGCIAFSRQPNPVGCAGRFTVPNNATYQKIMWFNLRPNTTYYWRIGTAADLDYSNIEWSDEWRYTTGSAVGAVLPRPDLISPPDNSTVSENDLTLKWAPVVGAVGYDFSLHDKDEDRWFGSSDLSASQTEIDESALAWIFNNTGGSNFEWNVKVRNDYAWSFPSRTRDFTLTNRGTHRGLEDGLNLSKQTDDKGISRIYRATD